MIITFSLDQILKIWPLIVAFLGIVWFLIKAGFDFKNLKVSVEDLKKSSKLTEDKVSTIHGMLIAVLPDKSAFLEEVAPGNSPRMINEKGYALLTNKGLIAIAEEAKEEVLKIAKENSPQNAYDAQEEIVNQFWIWIQQRTDYLNTIKNVAYEENTAPFIIAQLISIYLRDQLFPILGFEVRDTDKDDPSVKKDSK